MAAISNSSKVFCKSLPLVGNQCIRTLASTNVVQKPSKHIGKYGREMPKNVEEINSSVKAKFSPHRTRDSSSARVDVKMSQPSGAFGQEFMGSQGSKSSLKINSKTSPSDKHIGVYDATNSVSLSSVMQSNVPKPFETKGTDAPPHLGMPGGQWSQGDKYVSGDLHDHHNTSSNSIKRNPGTFSIHTSSSRKTETADEQNETMTQRQKLRRAVKDYGATVIVFHVTISLASLGFFYLLVSSGIDMSGLIEKLGINLTTLEQNSSSIPSSTSATTTAATNEVADMPHSSELDDLKRQDDDGRRKVQAVAAGVSTFVLAYAIHKVFAPVRIGITLTSTPFIVRHLRKIGVLKSPKSV